ncbi:MAG: coproporphyrinogen dehydrogenase HemZ [Clostridia bacterium]|nr:coproporphyrinogen dehydrogenase HemZ [Clostridia bacterium]
MILNIDGDINRYYVQSLCMIFFPGSTFAADEKKGEDVPEVTVRIYPDGEHAVTAYVSMRLNDKVSEATETVSLDEDIAIATHSSIAVGRALFAAGQDLLGYIPPWGILTGIRPAKVAASLLHLGKGKIKTRKIMRDEYFLNPQKAALAVSIASTEMKLLKKLPENTCSIYISIPFCPSRCAYCSFVSYSTARLFSLLDDYLDALLIELEETFRTIKRIGLNVVTVYIGGGTPTTLTPQQLERIFKKLCEHIDTHALMEFTLEAGRPDTITEEKLALAYKYGVSRVSVNPQTLSDDILREIGRKHTVADFYRAFELAQNSGIRDINVDLIAGLPNDDFDNFSRTVDKILELHPTNLTVHTFSVKKAADVLRDNSSIYNISGVDATKGVAYSQLKAKFAGYKPYYIYRQKNTVNNLENVGFSVEGHEGMYNIFMMEEVQTIFAVGAGAVTKLVDYKRPGKGESRIQRIFNPKYPYEYLKLSNSKRLGEKLDTRTKQEKIFEFYGITDF